MDNGRFSNAVTYTAEFSKINSYELEGKRKALRLAEKILTENTNAKVTMYDFDTDAPFIIAGVTVKDPQYKFLMEGHLDVVSPEGMEKPFDSEIKDGIMYGRGVADMKGGCAAMVSACFAAVNEGGLKGDLYLMFSTDEEYAGEEIKTALNRGYLPKVDFAMIAEPTDAQLNTAHKGEAWMQAEFFGKSAHSSTPHLGKNAIYMAMDFISELRNIMDTYSEQGHELYGEPTMSVGVIEGGSTPNVVPPYAKILIDKRYLPGKSAKEFEAEIESAVEACQKADPDFNVKTTLLGEWNSVLTDRQSPEFLRIKGVIDKSLGCDTPMGVMTGWGEGGYINMYGIPTVYFGPGDFRYAHRPDEQIPVDQIMEVAGAYYSVIKEVCC